MNIVSTIDIMNKISKKFRNSFDCLKIVQNDYRQKVEKIRSGIEL